MQLDYQEPEKKRILSLPMPGYRYTDYFENEVLRKRPYLRKDWCIYVIENAEASEAQEQNRYRF